MDGAGVRRRASFLVGWLLAIAGIALFARLGAWQLERMHAKQAMLDAVSAALEQRQAQPLAVAADPARSSAYDWAAGSGRFAALPPVVLDNQGREQRPGVRAYRVFVPAQGTPLLVELGWLPLPGDRTLPTVPLPQGTTQVAGLLSPPPSPGLARAPAVAQADGTLLAVALRPDALAAQLGLAALSPRVLKLDPAQSLPAGGPAYVRDLDILPNTLPPDRHLGYAVQWFGLALAVLVTALVVTFRKSSRKP